MQRMIDEQSRDIEEMQLEFSNATQLMQEKHANLMAKFETLTDLYQERPSRPEDLEMIKDLDEQIV